MKVLVLNSGSSSLKFEIIDTLENKSIVKGLCERIGIEGPLFTYKNLLTGFTIKEREENFKNHEMAIDLVLKELQDEEHGVIKDIEKEIEAIGHRVVQGGEYFKDSAVVTDDVLKKLEELGELAPLHNPANILGIKVMQKLLPGKKNVVVFDTSFHQTMEAKTYMYGLPYEDYTELKVRKYGAHGTSHKYVSQVVKEMLNKEDSKIIVCHLGNGASISAVRDGKVVDTSMGLTPLAGIMMGTRCGDIDPAAVLYVMKKRGLTAEEMDTRMNKKSGILGMFKQSSDFRDLQDAYLKGDKQAVLTMGMFINKIRNYIGTYIVALGGIDAIAFTGGIGENASLCRELVCKDLEFLGIKLDVEKNKERISGNVDYSTKDSKVRIYKIETQEEMMIAKDTDRLTR